MRVLVRAALRLIPAEWRESVERDLTEEAEANGARAHRRGFWRDVWIAGQAIRIAITFRRSPSGVPSRASGRGPFSDLGRDVRFALRTLIRERASTAAIVLTLAVGIGATSATYAVFNHVLFRPVPGVHDPASVASVYFQPANDLQAFGTAPRSALDVLRHVPAIVSLGSADTADLPVVLQADADPRFARVEVVTEQYLDTLAVRARAGRLFAASEFTPGHDVALISEELWHREFGGAASAIGRTVVINGHPFTIVGVVDGYQGWGPVRVGTVALWLPVSAEPQVKLDDANLFNLVIRLRPRTTPAVAEEQLRAAFLGVTGPMHMVMTTRSGPSNAPYAEGPFTFVPVIYPGLFTTGQAYTRGKILDVYPFALGATGLLLLLACANTANLLLAGTVRRERELALKSAIGAGRWRLARGLLTEAAMMAAAAVGLGLLFATLLVRAVRGTALFAVAPALGDVAIDVRVLAFTMALAVAIVVLFGFFPAFAASRAELRPVLHQAGTSTRAPRRLRALLVCVQLALSLTLMAGAGVLVRSLVNLRAIDLGMRSDGVVSFGMNMGRLGLNTARQQAIVRETLARLRQSAGIRAAAYSSPAAFWRDGWSPAALRPTGASAPDVTAEASVASGEFFGVLGIPLHAGRTFTDAEFQRRPGKFDGVAVINQSLARRLFGEAPPVGRRIDVGSGSLRGWEFGRQLEVIGVVGDTRSGYRFRSSERFALYEPASSRFWASTIYVDSSLPMTATVAAARRIVREIEPNLPLINVGTLREEVERLFPEDRVLAYLISGVAVLAMLLGVAGVYAVIARTVSERTREFAIRIALGASSYAVSAQVLGAVGLISAVGLAGGLGLFAVSSRVLASRAFGVSPLDPLSIGAAIGLLAATALLAAWLPARRAARVNPTIALRAD